MTSRDSLPDLPVEGAEELYENAPCGYVTTRPDGTIARVNQTLLEWTGYSRDELLSGRRFHELLTVPGRMYYETHLGPLLQMQGMVRGVAFDLVLANGEQLPVLVNTALVRDAEGRPLSTRTTLVDVTDRRRYERELLDARRRAEQLAGVVNASSDAIILARADGTIQTWNGGAETLFGWSADEAVGRKVSALTVPPDRREEHEGMLRELHAGREVRLETVRVDRSGRRINVSLTVTPHIEAPGEVVAISAIIRDVSERRRAEERLRREGRLQVVSTLAGGVAHEVNNQMTAVIGLAEFVVRALGKLHPQTRDVEDMARAAVRAAEMSRQLLAFSRQQLLDPRLLDLHEIVTELVPLLGDTLGDGKELVVGPATARGRVRADPRQLEEVLVNLVANARDATPAAGRVIITVEDANLGEEEVRSHPEDDVVPGAYVLVSVADTGTGMDAAILGRVFEPFFTTKSVGEGTGLGLSMVYGIVKQHGGQIWITSTPGQGTTVRVFLPVTEPD